MGKTEAERRSVIAAIGPLWSWHEVWLLSFGGVLFVAFPTILAVALAGFYLALFLVLWALVMRGVSLEVSGHLSDPVWRAGWHFGFVTSNVLLAVLIGAALGNVVRGVPLDASGKFTLSFFTHFSPTGRVGILDWYTVSVAVFIVAALAAHGATALTMRTDGPVHERSLRLARLFWKLTVALLLVVTAETWVVRPDLFPAMARQPFAWFGLLCVLGGLAAVVTGLAGKGEVRAVLGSCVLIAGLMIAGAAAVFPTMLHSTLDPQYSLDAYRSAASGYGLGAALWWWPLALVLSVVYAFFIARHYRGKVRVGEDSHQPY